MITRCFTILGVSAAMIGLLFAGPAGAACEFDGSIPGTAAKVYTIATPVATFYVDDRDYLDLDDDNQAGGVWLYLESNGQAGLQRGTQHVAFVVFEVGGEPLIPVIHHFDPTPVGPVTLFPNGYTVGGWGSRDDIGMGDPCGADGGDTILF